MKTTNFIPSKYQIAIYNFIQNGTGNGVVSAVAGSGKTTTLISAIKLIPKDKNVLFLAFNKTIKEEIASKVSSISNVTVKTVHGLGFSILMKEFAGIKILKAKYRVLLRDIYEFHAKKQGSLKEYDFKPNHFEFINNIKFTQQEEIEIENKIGYFNRIITLCDLGRINLIDMFNAETGIIELQDLAQKHNVEIINGECKRAWSLIKLGIHNIDSVDFTDMVYLPIFYKLEGFKFDFVFVDECQDLSNMQRFLMQKSIKPEVGRFIAVGDEKQAIYGFAGADATSFKKLCDLPNTIQLPLSVCYRCGKSILELAKSFVPTIEARTDAKEGVVEEDSSYKSIKGGDMVLCRQTFPLVSLCLKYLSKGIKAFVIGSEISESLAKMIAETQRKTEAWTMENVFSRLYNENNKLVKSVMQKEKLNKAEAEQSSTVTLHLEKIQVIELLSKGISEPEMVIQKIVTIFSKDENNEGICLSTIHKSKGLEADRVFIIHSELMPSKYAKQDWEIEQENNLIYVAYTRAKSHLGFVTDFNAWKDHESQADNVKEVFDSTFVGTVGGKVKLELEVILVKQIIHAQWGDSTLYEMKDKKGNIFSKFGVIADRFITSNHDEVKEGTAIKFNATVKAHNEYKGIKTTVLSTLDKY